MTSVSARSVRTNSAGISATRMILPLWHCPNLGSRTLPRCERRIPGDGLGHFGHPLLLRGPATLPRHRLPGRPLVLPGADIEENASAVGTAVTRRPRHRPGRAVFRIRFLGCTRFRADGHSPSVGYCPAVRFACVLRPDSVGRKFPVRAAYFRQVLPLVTGFPRLRVLCLVRLPTGVRRAFPWTVLLRLPAPKFPSST
jgi:hypothetical protein